MKIKLAVLTAACAFLSIGAATAAETVPWLPPAPAPPEATAVAEQPSPVAGFGSGTGAGPGGGTGSASSVASGFGSPISGSGAGSQTFGGGFTQQQTPGSGLLSNPSAISTGAGGGPLGP